MSESFAWWEQDVTGRRRACLASSGIAASWVDRRRGLRRKRLLELFPWLFPRKRVKLRPSHYSGAILKKLVVFLRTVGLFCLQLGYRKVEERLRYTLTQGCQLYIWLWLEYRPPALSPKQVYSQSTVVLTVVSNSQAGLHTHGMGGKSLVKCLYRVRSAQSEVVAKTKCKHRQSKCVQNNIWACVWQRIMHRMVTTPMLDVTFVYFKGIQANQQAQKFSAC